MRRTGRRFAGTLLAAAMASAACTSGSSGADEASASCAYLILYEGRTYQDVADVEFTIGRRLGEATLPACDDTGGQDEAEDPGTTLSAYEVDGISPKVAVAVGDSPDEAVFVAVRSGTELPAEVQKLTIDGS
ncbi:hypothetical protein GCM10023084_64850 [Streptomyces lacrimifluminis]|uniref:Lipoprotein n=1 Tax=Streptomyces lacrimifluminis TaxID=1500077 RepID=A0A917P2Y3_9ACTN|nr:DUF6281 family protein [Streptomyces lacrimifluminis]GGJ58236.1 hypothetical protein GCM10012282_64500 [Streptomyces lacrimifluminis]